MARSAELCDFAATRHPYDSPGHRPGFPVECAHRKTVCDALGNRTSIPLSFKQTFGRSTLHSRTAECCDVELDWSLVGLWIVQSFAVKEQIRIDRPPENSSVSLSLAIIRDTMDMCHETALNGSVLSRRLSKAVQDIYVRTSGKTARYKPNKKGKPSAQNPIVIKANAKQKKQSANSMPHPAFFLNGVGMRD